MEIPDGVEFRCPAIIDLEGNENHGVTVCFSCAVRLTMIGQQVEAEMTYEHWDLCYNPNCWRKK